MMERTGQMIRIDAIGFPSAFVRSRGETNTPPAGGPRGSAPAGRRVRTLLLAAALLLLPAAFAGALTLSTIDVRAGIPWLGVDGQGQVVAPPPLMYEYGISLPLNLNGTFAIVPEIDLFGTQYQLVGSGPRSIPTEVEYASSVWMLGIVVSPAVRFQLHVAKTLDWGMSLSPSIILHVPTTSYDLTSAQIGTITSYLYSKGRFFLPSAATFLDWQVLPKISLEFRVRSFFPIFHLWDGERLAFYDQLMIDGTLGIRFALR